MLLCRTALENVRRGGKCDAQRHYLYGFLEMKFEVFMERKNNRQNCKKKSYQLTANYVYLTTYV